MAIKSWANSATRRLFEKGRSAWPGLDVGKALNRLATLNAASRLDQIGVLRSVGLHPLKGDRKGQWAVNINGPWRLCFRFNEGHAHDVEVVDYH